MGLYGGIVNGVCAYCLSELDADKGPRCGVCSALHHRDCWMESRGCSVYGCAQSPDMLEVSSGSAAQGAWYQDPTDPSFERFWDGQQWTTQTRATQSPSYISGGYQ
jgi:hypothetical protein